MKTNRTSLGGETASVEFQNGTTLPLQPAFADDDHVDISDRQDKSLRPKGWMARLRLISILVTIILLGAVAIVIYCDREPRYQGRTLGDWLEDGKVTYNKFAAGAGRNLKGLESDPDWQRVRNAFSQMSPRAVPYLLSWAEATDSPLKIRLIIFCEEHPHFHITIQPAEDRNDAAKLGFMLLGNEAKAAWPALIRCTYDKDREHRLCALACLAGSRPGKELLAPVLLRLAHDPDKIVQLIAAELLSREPSLADGTADIYKSFPTSQNPSTPRTSANKSRSI